MNYWLIKSEEDTYSIKDLKRDKTTAWDGVRNYQARNFLRAMRVGDKILFYHSSCKEIGVAGLAKLSKEAYPDPTQFDKRSDYYDEKASISEPRWFCPEIAFAEEFSGIITLDTLRKQKSLSKMTLLQKGSRLSVQPVTPSEFATIVDLVS